MDLDGLIFVKIPVDRRKESVVCFGVQTDFNIRYAKLRGTLLLHDVEAIPVAIEVSRDMLPLQGIRGFASGSGQSICLNDFNSRPQGETEIVAQVRCFLIVYF